jgi:small subunit ribosomal protein S20
MPITRSAKKAHRQSLRRARFNATRKNAMSSAVKSVKKLALSGDKKAAQAQLSLAQKALDKAVKTGALNKNTAARKKSRLSKLVKKVSK